MTDSQKPRLPAQKVTAIARLKTLGSTFKRRNIPPPVVFPPPSWDLDDENIHRTRSKHTNSNHDLPEPVTFAKQLQSLIESSTEDRPAEGPSLEGASKATVNSSGLSGEPVPPGLDKDLVRMLASEDVMNGSRATSTANDAQKKKDNVWDILAGLKRNIPGGQTVEDEEDGLMIYAPLEPKEDSKIELAVPEKVVKPVTQPEASSSTKPRPQPRKKVVEKHVQWVPSTIELSVLTTWWGYRIYLPPAVMVKLDNKAIKATARAAMIATALKWLLEKIPLVVVPAQFRPGVRLLKRLVPLTGYIGAFVAWSWDRVRSLDEGTIH